MRIIAGTCRRAVLEVADDSSTRPFLEMARGALFNALGGKVDGAAVLDIFAGSGALGLEALSRGAESCLFIERDLRAFAALERNIAKCKMIGQARAKRADALQALTALAERGERFSLIFLDPPFPDLPEWRVGGKAETIMRASAQCLEQDGTLVFRLENGKAATPEWPGLRVEADRRYGRSRICRYRRETAQESMECPPIPAL